METKDKIVRAKVHMQKDNPFFAYLVMNLKIKEDKETPTMSVDNYGNIGFNSKWVDKLSENELKGVLSHEVLHLALEHFPRGKDKEHEIYNIAGDLVINDILVNNCFELPKGLVPYNHRFKINDNLTIEDLDKKSADEVYNELMKHTNKKGGGGLSGLNGSGFDIHIYPSKEKASGKSKDNQKSILDAGQNEKDWKKIFSEASVYARQQGNLPLGVERLIDAVLNEKISWKQALYKYITRELPYDYTYNRPSKRSIASGFYMPSVAKENMEIVISVDTSGSVGQDELSDFLAEIVGISKSFNNITMKLIVCDSDVQDVYDVRNGSIQTILDLKLRGGGGTSFITPLNYVKDSLPNTRFVIFFTDGYGDRIEQGDYPFGLIWVITKNGTDDLIKDSGEVIKLE